MHAFCSLSVAVMLLSIERGKLSTPYTLSQDGILVFRGLRDAGLGRCIGYFYNLSIPVQGYVVTQFRLVLSNIQVYAFRRVFMYQYFTMTFICLCF